VRTHEGGSRRAEAALAVTLLALGALCQGCASVPEAPATTGREGPRGYRALFRGTTESSAGKIRFRLAIALLPPDRLRLEFFGPAGGPRLVVASEGSAAVAILPGERIYDAGDADPATLERLVGLPLIPSQIIALLTGRPMCEPEVSEQRIQTRAAATFGRTLAWYTVTCPPGEIRYEARCDDRGGIIREASVKEGISGAIIVQAEYEDYDDRLGPRWPRRIRLRLAHKDAAVELVALEGPSVSAVPESIFSPPVPEGFVKRSLLTSLTEPGLLGSAGDGR